MSVANTGLGTVSGGNAILPVTVTTTTTTVPSNISANTLCQSFEVDDTHVYNFTMTFLFEMPGFASSLPVITVSAYTGTLTTQISSSIPCQLNSSPTEDVLYTTQVILTPATFGWGGSTPTYWITATQSNTNGIDVPVTLTLVATDLGVQVNG